MSTLGDVADVNPVIKFLPHTLQQLAVDNSDCLHDSSPQLWNRGHYVPPMPRDLPQLRRIIVEAVAAIDRQMLQRVWQELDYRIDICRITQGGHIEHL
jgi:hypothetical protein